MRILYSHRTRSADGQYVHIDALTRALEALGHEVLICGPDGTGRPDELARQLDAGQSGSTTKRPAKSLPLGLYEWAELGYTIPAYRQLAIAATRFLPDILYERYNLYHHAGELVAKRFELPRLLEVNAPLVDERASTGDLRLKRLGVWSEHRLWRGADVVLPVTQVLADIVVGAGVAREKIQVVPNAVEPHALHPGDGAAIRGRYPCLTDRCVLGFVGFVRPWHGVDRVIEWLATPAGNDAALMLVGDGPATPVLVALAKRLNVADRFVAAGVVQRQHVSDYIAAFDIALQPAVTAYASPLKLQEYMAQSRAIIAPDTPNIRETVTHGTNALLIAPDEKDALFQALSMLAGDAGLRARLGRAAQKTLVDRDMTWSGNAKRVTHLAEHLLEAQHARRRAQAGNPAPDSEAV